MHESYWEKRLADGSVEFGSDSMIARKIASWTYGRQDIISAALRFDNRLIRVTCPPNNGELASWRQLDNCMFNPAVGKSSRLAREIWCSPNDYKSFSEFRNSSGDLEIVLGDTCHTPIPEKVSFLVCSIGIGGRVSYRWS